jgi:TP901 family phage tail tape measure protein
MANAAGQSAEIVSDQMTAVWNNFDDGSKSLEYYADVMTALGAATASSTDEIAAGLEKFSAVANTVGLSYEYATSALATVTAETRQSADVVGTAFKTLFARIEGLSLGETLEDGTDLNKYSEALSKVGVNIKDASGQLRDMDDILNDLGARWQTLAKDE